MKKSIKVAADVFFYSALAFFLSVSVVMLIRRCDGQTKSDALSQEQDMQLEQILEEMRHDPVLIHQLDSMAELCYVRQFPFGPDGQIAKGMCRQFSRYNDD